MTANAPTATGAGQSVVVNFDKVYGTAAFITTSSYDINVDWITVEAYLTTSSFATLVVRNRYDGVITGTINVFVIGT